ncbi:MAG: malto-oligosyltrehalose trehalohydrolase [Chloroflexi bacterium]|nr:malto-oligosyltrehalose trehalohydrolase [Chloroflexota bacterium]
MMFPALSLGSTLLEEGVYQFRVWAPLARQVEVHITYPGERMVRLKPEERGYHALILPEVHQGTLYKYRLDSRDEFPDPASRSQPQGVHGPSEVVNPEFDWKDSAWPGLALKDYIIYELHVGAFTPEGTFEAAMHHLRQLRDLGITAVELMPVAQFPGERNWGYDGVYPFAVQNSYGGQQGLKRFVNTCHGLSLAVVLDVVYNHLGPDGNYLGRYGYYFTSCYRTLWGDALNFDGPYSDDVRRFFTENALYWLDEFHIDALRLDAVHAIADASPSPFIKELAQVVNNYSRLGGRRTYLIAESDANDARLVTDEGHGGYGLNAQWNDDFHHALHTLLTGERDGYYRDFGEISQLAKAVKDGFVYSGQYSAYRRRRHGVSSRDIPGWCLVVFAQNHDQVGNRMLGERLSTLVSFERLKLAAGLVVLAPNIPLLFMGEEYGEATPFQYFTSHEDPALVQSVREGRSREFAAFSARREPPDPQAEATFRSCKLDRSLSQSGHHRALLRLYKELIRLRRGTGPLANLEKRDLRVDCQDDMLIVWRWRGDQEVATAFNLGNESTQLSLDSGHTWRKLLDSSDRRWLGPGSALPETVDAPETDIAVPGGTFVCFLRE